MSNQYNNGTANEDHVVVMRDDACVGHRNSLQMVDFVSAPMCTG